MDSSRQAESIRVHAKKARSKTVQNSNLEVLFALQSLPTDLSVLNGIAKTTRAQVTLGPGTIPIAQDALMEPVGNSLDVLKKPLVDWPR
jgi:hypothetical protein